MGAEYRDRFAALHQQRFIIAEAAQRLDRAIEGGPVAHRFARAAVDDEILGSLGDIGIQVVHQHAHRGLLLPTAAGELRSARCADDLLRR
jgi:hypothetical protein